MTDEKIRITVERIELDDDQIVTGPGRVVHSPYYGMRDLTELSDERLAEWIWAMIVRTGLDHDETPFDEDPS